MSGWHRARPAAPDSDEPWRLRAACIGSHPDLFFPTGSAAASRAQVVEAKSVCGRCPVVSECFAWALRTAQPHGVWGGYSEEERKLLLYRIRSARDVPRIPSPRHAQGATA